MDRKFHYLITGAALLFLALIVVRSGLAFKSGPDLVHVLEYEMNYLDVRLKPH